MLSKVLLPQPDGPISDTTSPSAIDRLTPSTATTTPPCLRIGEALADVAEFEPRASSHDAHPPVFWRRVLPSMPPATAHSANTVGLGSKSRGFQFSVSTSSSA